MLSFGLSWLLSYFCATIWPTYASFKALGTPGSADDTQWLTYWVVYSCLTFLEAVASSFTTWFPLYYEARLLFVLWLVLPQTKGAHYIFENYIAPMMKRYNFVIEPAMDKAEKLMNSPHVTQAVQLSEQYGPAIAQQALQRAAVEAQRIAASQKSYASGASQAPPASTAPSARYNHGTSTHPPLHG